ncbi:uncharacterized protein NEPG_02043 [Nematocida parisii ERTm1]|uniref:Phosphotransferase n=1 Tax=Nematocida parisii (strain ERTm3) TaxID=935791 RepID=I3EF68_NEMP3|nr:uncharacterized protein NEPG_02043 [Nematocida parisii ERTm1]EIJ87865.1 hypothetical protein NEQG_01937 [Nematocida parisii ERTm3]KAI5128158.1 hexokinase [Nematocida parisii]EIJ93087.1 hypothetical protein NEPG_02043 [Nematocida parisii ERTm1]KAI5128395.1 hexokinase [Nematocida parisii]KAI5141677.1 hexokinase [Nematocida parisii]|eukprot:XP_013059870.1 hypothetical protein NEPG_02043 [Nematocida parisii ERTm1]
MKFRSKLIAIIYGVIMGGICSCSASTKEDKIEILKNLATDLMEHLEESVRDTKSSLMQSQFIMQPTGVTAINSCEDSNGAEILCADLGGTSLKLDIYKKDANSRKLYKVTKDTVKHIIPKTKEDIGERTIYEFMAEKINAFVAERREKIGGVHNKPMHGALTFSYPLERHGDKIKVTRFTKKFNWKRVTTDESISEIPLDELNKLTAEHVKFNVIVNDTTALGAWACSTYEDAIGGFVLGTGVNCSYLENMQIITNGTPENVRVILNTECGGFDFKGVHDLMDDIDKELDEQAEKEKGVYLLEKMVGGLYFEKYINLFFTKKVQEMLGNSEVELIMIRDFKIKNSELSPEQVAENITKLFSETFVEKSTLDQIINLTNNTIENTVDRKYRICAGLLAGIICKHRRNNKNQNTYIFGLTGSGCNTKEFEDQVIKYILMILGSLEIEELNKIQIQFKFSEEASLEGGASAFIDAYYGSTLATLI